VLRFNPAFLSVEHLAGNELSLVAFGVFAFYIVRKEKQLEHEKNDGKLDEDDGPKRFAQCHRPKSIVVEMEYLI